MLLIHAPACAAITRWLRHGPLLLLAPVLALMTGCATNPVTGESQLMLVSEQQDFAIGRDQYLPTQQAQGGQYYLDPDLTEYVRKVGRKLGKVSDRPDLPYEFVILNNSVPNAWALPSGKIAVNRGLLTELKSEAQLAAVLGHEIVHAAARHTAQSMQSGMLLSAGLAGVGLAMGDNSYRDILLGAAGVGVGITMAKFSRSHESESDEYGMKYMARAGYDPMAAVELQEIFVQLSKNHQSSWMEGLFTSHPPSEDRVAQNRVTAMQLTPTGNFRGEREYQKAVAKLMKQKPAYDAFDAGMAAFAKEDLQTAMKKANEAIKLLPNEAMFYALRGDIYTKQGKDSEALKEYQKAVDRNPQQFDYLLKKGATEQALGKNAEALKDLQRANELLPTSVGYYLMGESALGMNDPNSAYRFFQIAGQGGGEVSQQARKRAQQLVQQYNGR